MEKLNKDHQMTFVFSTHDARVITRAHRVVTLRDGAIESDLPTGNAGVEKEKITTDET